MITKVLLRRSLANDFALLFTDAEFDLAEHIDTVCLPQVLLIISLMMVLIVITMTEIILVQWHYPLDGYHSGFKCYSPEKNSTTPNVLPLVGAKTSLGLRDNIR